MGLFSADDLAKINAAAQKSQTASESAKQKPSGKKAKKSMGGITSELDRISEKVREYFDGSDAILITTEDDLHNYISDAIAAGYVGIDTETTGLDRVNDTIVGTSLYFPNGLEAYIPIKHISPIFETPYPNQLSYEVVGREYQRFVDAGTRMIFANADFDLGMIYKDLHVDMIPVTFYDVILAWRCIKENEKHNGLKELYSKYVLKGAGDPMKFKDFFTPELFPFCKPEIAALYAAHDAKITYELFMWQMQFLKKDNPQCKKRHLEAISDLIFGLEIPMISVCQNLHRRGVYLEKSAERMVKRNFLPKFDQSFEKLYEMIQAVLDDPNYSAKTKQPFRDARDFNPNSYIHVKWLVYDLMKLGDGKETGTNKEVLRTYNTPVTNQILLCRSYVTLRGMFVDKLSDFATADSRIHCTFKQIGADTGRMSSDSPNMQQIPSRHGYIRRMFRATPGYVMMSSDYSKQEPAIAAYLSQDENMIQAFKDGRDIYSYTASLAFNVPYEECVEFKPDGSSYPEGKERRTGAKSITLGTLYGRSIPSIAEQIYPRATSKEEEEENNKKAQKVYDSVMNAFSGLRRFMAQSIRFVKQHGFVETILGRRRHIPDMQLPEFEFLPAKGYINPDIDPLDADNKAKADEIPQRIKDALYRELVSYKYFGQVARRIKQLYEDQHIKVINNRRRISDASREVINSQVQGSAADMTKIAMLKIENDPEWQSYGGRILIPVHDEIIAEVPMEYAEQAGKRLSELMCAAADFLPFPMKCDVETTYRWYGLEFPCPYPQPESLEDLTDDGVRWIQYHLFEYGYSLPIIKDFPEEKLEGHKSKGVNGKITDEMQSFIDDYCGIYGINRDEFINHIHAKVHTGYAPGEEPSGKD